MDCCGANFTALNTDAFFERQSGLCLEVQCESMLRAYSGCVVLSGVVSAPDSVSREITVEKRILLLLLFLGGASSGPDFHLALIRVGHSGMTCSRQTDFIVMATATNAAVDMAQVV